MNKDLNKIAPKKVQKGCIPRFLNILRCFYRKGKILLTGNIPADGCSINYGGETAIYLMDIQCAESPMKDLTGAELVLFLFGLFCHELFHLFYSDFAYPEQAIEAAKRNAARYPNLSPFLSANADNVRLCKNFINVIEDGHIERRGKKNYPLWRRYIDFMNKVYFSNSPVRILDHPCNAESFKAFQSYFVFALKVALTGGNYDLEGCKKPFRDACLKSRIYILDAVYENDAQKRIDKALHALEEALGDLPKPKKEDVQNSEKEIQKTQNGYGQAGASSPSPSTDINDDGLEKPQPNPQPQSGSNSKSGTKKGKGTKTAGTPQKGSEQTAEDQAQMQSSSEGEVTEQEGSQIQEGSESEAGETAFSSIAQAENPEDASQDASTDEPYDFEDENGTDLSDGIPGGNSGGNGDSDSEAKDNYEDSILSQIEKDLESEFKEFEEQDSLKRELDRTIQGGGKKSRFTDVVCRTTSATTAINAGETELNPDTRAVLKRYIDQTVRKVSEEVKTRTEDGVIPYQFSGRFNSGRISDFYRKTGADRFRLFDRMTEGDEGLDIAVELLIDESGSMSGKEDEVIAISYILFGICNQLGIPIRVASYDGSKTHVFCEFDAPMQPKSFEKRIVRYNPNGGTNEGQILQLFEKSFAERPETCKYLFMITDGAPGWFLDDARALNELEVTSEKDWLKKYQLFLKKAYGIQMVACCTGSDAENVASIYTGAKIIFNDYKVLAKRLTEEFLRPLKT